MLDLAPEIAADPAVLSDDGIHYQGDGRRVVRRQGRGGGVGACAARGLTCNAASVAAKVEYGWARSGDLHIAYEVRGDAPVDLVLVPGLLNTLTASKVVPRLARVDDELCRFARVIKLDKRGTGLSDRFPAGPTPTVEERMDDVRAVMDAVGSERACVMGTADGGPIAMMFAATYPERVASLVLDSTAPRTRWAPDWPWGSRDEERDVYLSLVKTTLGTRRDGRAVRGVGRASSGLCRSRATRRHTTDDHRGGRGVGGNRRP